MAGVADIHTIIEIPGHIGIYEVMENKALVKECADREEAEAWMAHVCWTRISTIPITA